GDAHADRRDLLVPDPHAGQPRLPAGADAVAGEGPNEGLLDVADVAMEVTPVGLEVEDRVSYELTRPVIGHIAPASGLEERNAHEPALGLVGQYVLRIRGRAQRDDVRGLEEQGLVREPAGPEPAEQGLVLAEGVAVGDRPQA